MPRVRPLHEVIEQDTRQRLLSLVAACPGVSLGDAARALGVDYSTIQYHVRVLTRAAALHCEAADRIRLHLSAPLAAAANARLALDAPGSRDIADVVRARGPCSVQDVVMALDVPRSTAKMRLARLANVGVLAVEDDGNRRLYRWTGFAG